MRRRIIAALALVMAAVVAPPASLVAAGPDPNQPYIQSISYGGTGCPGGSVGQSISSDRLSFTLIFDRYVASTGPSVPVTDSRKDCQINLTLRLPKNSGNTILAVEYRGYTQLGPSTSASQEAVYFENGDPFKGSDADFSGPAAQDYLATATVPLHLQKYDGQCGAQVPVNIKTSVQLADPSHADSSQITTDSVSGTIKLTGNGKARNNAGC